MATPMYMLPNTFIVKVVAREDAAMFTILLPINMVLSILLELEITFSNVMARLFPCSAREWIRMRLAAVIDVSAEEKKADSNTRISMVTACIGTLESKLYSLLFDNYNKKNIHDSVGKSKEKMLAINDFRKTSGLEDKRKSQL